jgi:hypothetical protein
MQSRRVLWKLFVREVHEQTRTHRFAVLTTVAAVMTPLIVYAGIRDYAVRQTQYQLLREQRDAPDAPRSANRLLGRMVEPDFRLIRPPVVATLLVRGFSSSVPRYWDFAPDGLHPGPVGDPASRSPQSGLSLDMEFLVRVVLGLLAILLAGGALAEERDSGTFYVLATQPVRSLELFVARLGGGLVALGLALTLVMTGFVAAIAVIQPDLWSTPLAMAALGFSFVSMMFLAMLYSIGLVVGAVAASTSSANIAAASIWIIIAVASVPTIDFVTRVVAPLRSVEAIESRRQLMYTEGIRAAQQDVGAWYFQIAGPNWRSVKISTEARAELRRTWTSKAQGIRQELEQVDQEAIEAARRERRMWGALAWLTPGTLFFDATSRLGKTGLPVVEQWDRAGRARQQALNLNLFDDPPLVLLLLPDPAGVGRLQADLRSAVEPGAIRLPEPQEPTFRQAVIDALPPLAGLAVCQILFLCLSFLAFRRISY